MESRTGRAGQKGARPLKGKEGLLAMRIATVVILICCIAQRYGKPVEPGANPQVGNFVHLSQPEAVERVEVRDIPQPYSLMKMRSQWRNLKPISTVAATQTTDEAV